MVTNQMSQSNTPLIHQVIPLMDGLTRAFDKFIGDSELHLAVRYAAKRGLAILNKYYSLTDDSIVYRISMCKFHNLLINLLISITCFSASSSL